jgi:hypothetical protein
MVVIWIGTMTGTGTLEDARETPHPTPPTKLFSGHPLEPAGTTTSTTMPTNANPERHEDVRQKRWLGEAAERRAMEGCPCQISGNASTRFRKPRSKRASARSPPRTTLACLRSSFVSFDCTASAECSGTERGCAHLASRSIIRRSGKGPASRVYPGVTGASNRRCDHET